MNVKLLRLVSGEDVICEVDENLELKENNLIGIKNPVQISLMPPKPGEKMPTFGVSPFPMVFTQTDKVDLKVNRNHIIFECNPPEEFVQQYESIFGSGIIKPSKTLII